MLILVDFARAQYDLSSCVQRNVWHKQFECKLKIIKCIWFQWKISFSLIFTVILLLIASKCLHIIWMHVTDGMGMVNRSVNQCLNLCDAKTDWGCVCVIEYFASFLTIRLDLPIFSLFILSLAYLMQMDWKKFQSIIIMYLDLKFTFFNHDEDDVDGGEREGEKKRIKVKEEILYGCCTRQDDSMSIRMCAKSSPLEISPPPQHQPFSSHFSPSRLSISSHSIWFNSCKWF